MGVCSVFEKTVWSNSCRHGKRIFWQIHTRPRLWWSTKRDVHHSSETLNININTRFPCINTSIDTRLARQNADIVTLKLNEGLLNRMRRSCPFMLLLGVFMFPDDLIKLHMVNEFFLGGRYPEIEVISRDCCKERRDCEKGSNIKWWSAKTNTDNHIARHFQGDWPKKLSVPLESGGKNSDHYANNGQLRAVF